MIHLFSHRRILAITSEGVRLERTRGAPRVGVPFARAEVRSIHICYVRAGVTFRLRELGPFSRSRVLRNRRCQSSRRVDIARPSLPLLESRKKGVRTPRPGGACRIFGFIGLREKFSRGGRKEGEREREREGEQLFGKESSGSPSNVIFEENGLRGEITERNRVERVE